VRRAFSALCLALAACQPANVPPGPPPYIPDGGPITADAGSDASLCEQACANLARLNCSEATSACAPTCGDQLAAGLGATDPICAARAADRSEMQRCGPDLCL
jgi:hypothetical protein